MSGYELTHDASLEAMEASIAQTHEQTPLDAETLTVTERCDEVSTTLPAGTQKACWVCQVTARDAATGMHHGIILTMLQRAEGGADGVAERARKCMQ